MESSLKIALGIAAGALVIGLLGIPAMGFGMMGGSGNDGMRDGYGTGMMGRSSQGMMGGGMMGNSGTGMIGGGMMGNGNGFASGNPFGSMADMHGGNFDMNAMHRAMHGEEPEVDMNRMHARMLAGNLTQEDIPEMSEHCPMMRNRNATNETAQ